MKTKTYETIPNRVIAVQVGSCTWRDLKAFVDEHLQRLGYLWASYLTKDGHKTESLVIPNMGKARKGDWIIIRPGCFGILVRVISNNEFENNYREVEQ